MSAFKKLNKQDTYITTYVAHKQWNISGSEFVNQGDDTYGIETFIATGSYFNSIKQLYYPNKTGSNISTHFHDYSTQTTLYFSESRNLISGSVIISIPSKLYGSYINPEKGFKVVIPTGNTTYVDPFYWNDDYVQDTLQTGLEEYGEEVEILDDGEGNLYTLINSEKRYVGDIIYPQGIIIITDTTLSTLLQTAQISLLDFQSSKVIYTYNFHCKVREFENTFTNNPTAFKYITEEGYYNDGTLYTGSLKVNTGELKHTLTGSEFSPYITTVGLYNDTNELVAVGKLTLPVPKSQFTEMTFNIKLDI